MDFDFNSINENSSFNLLFSSPPDFDYITPQLDLDINPDHFVKWLEAVLGDEIPEGEYNEKIANMCEYSCLYLAMKFRLSKLEGELRLIPGQFGFWEHWWAEYIIKDDIYIIDLTLQQFKSDAPKLAILKATYDKTGYRKDEHCDYSYSLKDYCDEKKAFMFYPHPFSVE